MDSRDHEVRDQLPLQSPLDYKPPQVERVLDPSVLEREVLYAGGSTAVQF